jgi:uncharacterized membrane protein
LLGLAVSVAGGGLIGLMSTLSLLLQDCPSEFETAVLLVLLGVFSGLFGSVLDSLLGAN